jgi:hypothetical protein
VERGDQMSPDNQFYRGRIIRRVDFALDLWSIRIDPGGEFKTGALLDIHFSPAKLLRSLVNRRLKLFNCTPSPGGNAR